MAARAAGPHPKRAVPGTRNAAAGAVCRAAAAPDARRADVVAEALTAVDLQTFCPYKGIASYYDIDDIRHAAWSYRSPLDDMAAIGDLVSFEPDRVEVTLDGQRLKLEPGQTVVS